MAHYPAGEGGLLEDARGNHLFLNVLRQGPVFLKIFFSAYYSDRFNFAACCTLPWPDLPAPLERIVERGSYIGPPGGNDTVCLIKQHICDDQLSQRPLLVQTEARARQFSLTAPLTKCLDKLSRSPVRSPHTPCQRGLGHVCHTMSSNRPTGVAAKASKQPHCSKCCRVEEVGFCSPRLLWPRVQSRSVLPAGLGCQ